MKPPKNPYGGDQPQDFISAALDGLQYRIDGIQATLDALRATVEAMQSSQPSRQALIRPAVTPEQPSPQKLSWTPERRAKQAAEVRKRWKAGVYDSKRK